MNEETEKKLYDIINEIPVTDKNQKQIDEIKIAIKMGEYKEVIAKLKKLNEEDEDDEEEEIEIVEEPEGIFPKQLQNQDPQS